VLVDDRHGNLRRLGVATVPDATEDRPEERRDENRHREGDQDGTAVTEKDLQVFADERTEGCHQSRKLRPVSSRNNVSSDAGPGTPALKPRIVSSASTRPWSMTTMRSARRSASSM